MTIQIDPKTKDIMTVMYVLVSLIVTATLTYLYISCKRKGETFSTCQGLDRQVWSPWGEKAKLYNSGQLTETTELVRPYPPHDYTAPITQFHTYDNVDTHRPPP